MAPMGCQWFDLSMGDMSIIGAGVKRAAPALDSFLDAELERGTGEFDSMILEEQARQRTASRERTPSSAEQPYAPVASYFYTDSKTSVAGYWLLR